MGVEESEDGLRKNQHKPRLATYKNSFGIHEERKDKKIDHLLNFYVC